MMKRHLLVLIFILVLLRLTSDAADTATLKVLFVGNSLTYTNNLPQMVKELARHDSVKLEFTSFCFPNYSLENHWEEGRVQAEIKDGHYDYVIAQQGPSAMPSSQQLLVAYARKFAAACKDAGTKLYLFTVWPAKQREGDLDAVIASYKLAAKQTGSLLAPAGLGWKEIRSRNPAIALYGTDDFHPSPKGSWLSAFIIYASLQPNTNLQFITTSNGVWRKDLSKEEIHLFQSVVANSLNSSF